MEHDMKSYNDPAELLKVLAHPVRLCIVSGLLERGCCNVTYMQECLSLPQSTVSQHLQKLRLAGIIEGERNGLEIKYKVINKKAIEIVKVLLD